MNPKVRDLHLLSKKKAATAPGAKHGGAISAKTVIIATKSAAIQSPGLPDV